METHVLNTNWKTQNTLGRYKEHKPTQLEESITELRVGRKWLSKPEPYIGCSAL